MNAESREILSEQLKVSLKSENFINFKSLLFSNPSFQLDLINTVKELLPRNEHELLRDKMATAFLEENEHSSTDFTLEQAPQYSKIVKFLVEDNPSRQMIHKLQNLYMNRVKKNITKKTVKNLSFWD